jgi:hypothetical protein
VRNRLPIELTYRRLVHTLERAKEIESRDRKTGLRSAELGRLRDRLESLVNEADYWVAKGPLVLDCDHRHSPGGWVSSILERAETCQGTLVAQHLVAATLQRRHPEFQVPNHPGHAANLQTGRTGDFTLNGISYHVTATDGKEAIQRCKQNIETGVHPVLLVPRQYLVRAVVHAENAGIQNRVSVLSIEDFITQNIIELSTGENANFFETLKDIVAEYNRRLEEVETDMSLKIELS